MMPNESSKEGPRLFNYDLRPYPRNTQVQLHWVIQTMMFNP
jgi:hypothetical protein